MLPLFSIAPDALEESLDRLNKTGCLKPDTEQQPTLTLSPQGTEKLKDSPYWGYAEQLKRDSEGDSDCEND